MLKTHLCESIRCTVILHFPFQVHKAQTACTIQCSQSSACGPGPKASCPNTQSSSVRRYNSKHLQPDDVCAEIKALGFSCEPLVSTSAMADMNALKASLRRDTEVLNFKYNLGVALLFTVPLILLGIYLLHVRVSDS